MADNKAILLPTNQRRLRHVQCVGVRHLIGPQADATAPSPPSSRTALSTAHPSSASLASMASGSAVSGAEKANGCLQDCFFTLVDPFTGKEFYRSEVCFSTSNATWKTVDQEQFDPQTDSVVSESDAKGSLLASSRVLVKVFSRKAALLTGRPLEQLTALPRARDAPRTRGARAQAAEAEAEGKGEGTERACPQEDEDESERVAFVPLADKAAEAAGFALQLYYDLDLFGLTFIDRKLDEARALSFPPNTLVLQMRGGWYASLPTPSPSSPRIPAQHRRTPSTLSSEEAASGTASTTALAAASTSTTGPSSDETIGRFVARVNNSKVKRSYGRGSLEILLSKAMVLRQMVDKAERAKQAIAQPVHNAHRNDEMKRTVERARLRVRHMQEELLSQRSLLERQRDSLANARVLLDKRTDTLCGALESLNKAIQALNNDKTQHVQARESLRNVRQLVSMRQTKIILELHAIYPIKPTSATSCSILDKQLPNVEFTGCDDDHVSTALGYVAHLVFLIAKYLEIPLRHSVIPMCSRSTIRDDISSHISDKERTVPLYFKGKETAQFDYGVFYLNKDIQQLVNFVGGRVSDPRSMLPNLRMLMTRLNQQYQYFRDLQQGTAGSNGSGKGSRAMSMASEMSFSISRAGTLASDSPSSSSHA